MPTRLQATTLRAYLFLDFAASASGPHNSILGADRPAHYEMYPKVERIP